MSLADGRRRRVSTAGGLNLLNMAASPVLAIDPTQMAIASDGSRFFVRCNSADAVPTSLPVAVNWQGKLR